MRAPLTPVVAALLAAVAATLVPVPVAAQTSRATPLADAARREPTPLADAARQAPATITADAVRRLSLEEAVRLALEQNLGIRIQRIDPQIQDVNIALSKSFWSPTVSTSFSRNGQSQRSTSVLSGGATSVDNGTFANGLGIAQQLPWGGGYQANWNNQRVTTTNLFSSFSPQLLSTVSFNYTQPLLDRKSTRLNSSHL